MSRFQIVNLSIKNKIARAIWHFVWLFLYRPSPSIFHGWRRILLTIFGANIARCAHPYPSAKIWAPWNLTMGPHSCLSHNVDCYNVAHVKLGSNVTVSQYSFLCTATKDYRYLDMPLMVAPISIEDNAWVAADSFIGPGVVIAEGAVVCARSTVLKNVASWSIVSGSPAFFIRDRKIKAQ